MNSMERMFSSSWRYAIPRFFKDTRFRIKMAYQRVKYGYDGESIWSHHSWNSRITAEILRKLAKDKVGCPIELYDKKNKKDECAKWRDVLIEMAKGFEAATSIDNLEYHTEKRGKFDLIESNKKYKELKNKFDKGIKLYHKFYFNLWD